jgi:hypothetical protein
MPHGANQAPEQGRLRQLDSSGGGRDSLSGQLAQQGSPGNARLAVPSPLACKNSRREIH